MRNKAVEYPHPVLNEYTNDYIDCNFAIRVLGHSDTGNTLDFDIEYSLKSSGIEKLLADKIAKIFLRITCYRTSFREIRELNVGGITKISIPKKQVTGVIDFQAIVAVTGDYDEYRLSEFNRNYFGNTIFRLRKGSVIANEPGIKITLNTVLEKNASSIVQVRSSASVSEIKVNFAKTDETDVQLTDYIVITMPEAEYLSYCKLRTKKHLKNGVDRFLQASVILPAIVEAVSLLRTEEICEEDDNATYKGTVWAGSIYNALSSIGISDLASSNQSAYELANKILGNVARDALNNLMQKMNEWSTIKGEDEAL